MEMKEKRSSVAVQRQTKVELDMIKAKLQITHDEVIMKLIELWEQKNEVK